MEQLVPPTHQQQLQQQHQQLIMGLLADDKSQNENFVYKLYRMVEDQTSEHLIFWSQNGTSFIVANAMEFSRDVLPKFFKHNNFSSYIRQLNMYGFHKVNEAPRSPRANTEQQVWEFSHPKFLRGHPELLNDIKRKVSNGTSGGTSPRAPSPNNFVEAPDATEAYKQQQLNLLQNIQSEVMKQVAELQHNFQMVLRELSDTKRRLTFHQDAMRRMLETMMRMQSLLGPNVRLFDPNDFAFLYEAPRIDPSPSIYVSSSPDFASYMGYGGFEYGADTLPPFFPTQSTSNKRSAQSLQPPEVRHHRSSSYSNAINTPLPPSPFGSPLEGSPIGDSATQDEYDMDDEATVKQEGWRVDFTS